MSENTADLIVEKAKAGYPALYLLSSEDLRSLKEIKRAAEELDRNFFIWTLGKGMFRDFTSQSSPPPGATGSAGSPATRGAAMRRAVENQQAVQGPVKVNDTEGPSEVLDAMDGPQVPPKSIIVLRLYHHHLDEPIIHAKLLELIPKMKTSARTLVVLTPVQKLPKELEKEFTLVESSYPDKEELGRVLDGIVKGSNLPDDLKPNPELRKEIIESALGLTTSEAENAFSLALVRPKRRTGERKWDPKVVLDEKCLALRKTGLLEYIPNDGIGMGSVGGMKALKAWVSKRRRAWTPEALQFGLRHPKGILMVGPPGSGKSLGAKAISEAMGLPLIRLDMGKMFGSLVGESERNMRTAIQIAEAIAPCALWVDELEKGMAGSGSNLDSGVTARLLGFFLTWMQEKKSPVFVYATANNVSSLPPELLRKGRFDEMFSVLLPTESEREEIFRIHLEKRKRGSLIGRRAPGHELAIDLSHFSKETQGFSGAEIEACIEEAMFEAFDEGKELNFMHLQQAVDTVVPLSTTMKEQLQRMEDWCKGRTRPANGEETQIPIEQLIPGGRLVDIGQA